MEKSKNARYLSMKQACEYTSMGRTTFGAFAKRIGAVRKLSDRMIRYDREAIDAALADPDIVSAIYKERHESTASRQNQ